MNISLLVPIRKPKAEHFLFNLNFVVLLYTFAYNIELQPKIKGVDKFTQA